MSKEKRFVIQVDPLEIEDDAIFDNKELRLYECQSGTMSDICSLLNQQDAKITDLEAKLAESEKSKEINIKERDKICLEIATDYNRQILELEQQLEEVEGQYAYECECDKQFVECQNENEKLKQQLAEKEKEIEKLKEMHIVESPIDWKEVHKAFRKFSLGEVDMLKLEYPDKFHNQSKTEFAIQQLQRVKEEMHRGLEFDYDLDIWATEFIDKIIKEIGGENGDV